ncbi:MAG: TetR family transcriptional regulator C-terminal domain-containing protein [Candidatus Sabulitectum sp.]|nr:TetR family transcriptional regulator C-terminal domain-containing protein [Candidatus Sabulitectum sp.]
MRADTEKLILEKGAKLVRKNGFNRTSLKMILDEAGVPKGSFYYYFETKEVFGIKLIEYLHSSIIPVFASVANADSSDLEPLDRLKAFFGYFRTTFTSEEIMSGCPIGNISQEMAALNPRFRAKLTEVFKDITSPIAQCLQQAVDQGSLSGDTDPAELADFIVNSWQGALIALKVRNTAEPLLTFEKYVFDHLLKPERPAEQEPEKTGP